MKKIFSIILLGLNFSMPAVEKSADPFGDGFRLFVSVLKDNEELSKVGGTYFIEESGLRLKKIQFSDYEITSRLDTGHITSMSWKIAHLPKAGQPAKINEQLAEAELKKWNILKKLDYPDWVQFEKKAWSEEELKSRTMVRERISKHGRFPSEKIAINFYQNEDGSKVLLNSIYIKASLVDVDKMPFVEFLKPTTMKDISSAIDELGQVAMPIANLKLDLEKSIIEQEALLVHENDFFSNPRIILETGLLAPIRKARRVVLSFAAPVAGDKNEVIYAYYDPIAGQFVSGFLKM